LFKWFANCSEVPFTFINAAVSAWLRWLLFFEIVVGAKWVEEAERVRRDVCAYRERILSWFEIVPVEEEKSCPFPEVESPLRQRSKMRSGFPSYSF